MKRIILLSILVSLSVLSESQIVNDIFDPTKSNIVWLGVDFTQARYEGDPGTVSNYEFIPLYEKINLLIVTETKEFNFTKALRKPGVPYDLKLVNEINTRIDAEKIVTDATSVDANHMTEQSIADLVKEYDANLPGPIGLVFFMEKIDKTKETGTMWVTFFDISTREVLLTERMTGKAGGIGFRNHWAETIKQVISQIKSRKYKEWYNRTL